MDLLIRSVLQELFAEREESLSRSSSTRCAGDLLVSWAAHDDLHLQQSAVRLRELVQRDLEPYDARYASA